MNNRESTTDPRLVGYLIFVSLPVIGLVTTTSDVVDVDVDVSSTVECRRIR